MEVEVRGGARIKHMDASTCCQLLASSLGPWLPNRWLFFIGPQAQVFPGATQFFGLLVASASLDQDPMPAVAERVPFIEKLRRAVEKGQKVRAAIPTLAARELRRCGKFTMPGLLDLKVKTKPATKAVVVKAKPARKVVIGEPAPELKAAVVSKPAKEVVICEVAPGLQVAVV